MIKFPSIGQYRNVIRTVKDRAQFVQKTEAGEVIYDLNKKLPVLDFIGTVKLHGTNAAIVKDYRSANITFQSREREITVINDNAGFALQMTSKINQLNKIIDDFVSGHLQHAPQKVAVFGEWCGGNIQKGVALNQLDNMFVVFSIKIIYNDDWKEWADLDQLKKFSFPEHKIYSIVNFPLYNITIDFNKPEEAQNMLVDFTNNVELECPFAKVFGISGVGEGIVYKCITEGWKSSDFWFKVKGEKHQSSKVKTLAPVDVELIDNVNIFCINVCTESRLMQGYDVLIKQRNLQKEMATVGPFVKWVQEDVIKEELDSIVENKLDVNMVKKTIANICKKWFINKLNQTE